MTQKRGNMCINNEGDFIAIIAAVAGSFFILEFSCAVNYQESQFKDKISKIFMVSFWGLSVTTIIGGYIYQIIKFHIGTGG